MSVCVFSCVGWGYFAKVSSIHLTFRQVSVKFPLAQSLCHKSAIMFDIYVIETSFSQHVNKVHGMSYNPITMYISIVCCVQLLFNPQEDNLLYFRAIHSQCN